MSDAYVQVAPDSTGKKIQTFENTVSGNLVESQAVVLVNSSGAPITPVTGAGGSNTQVQYNNSGAFGGISGATTDGTKMTLATPDITTGFTVSGSAVAKTQLWSDGTNYVPGNSFMISPRIRFKVLGTALTTGTPADIATITIPNWIASATYHAGNGQFILRGTGGAGTAAAANFLVRDAAGGAGAIMTANVAGPTGGGNYQAAAVGGFVADSTSTTLYIRQTSNSANPLTIIFFVELFTVF